MTIVSKHYQAKEHHNKRSNRVSKRAKMFLASNKAIRATCKRFNDASATEVATGKEHAVALANGLYCIKDLPRDRFLKLQRFEKGSCIFVSARGQKIAMEQASFIKFNKEQRTIPNN